MKIKDIYNLAIELGIKNDLRPKEHIKNLLRRAKENYEKLDAKKKKEFDVEKLHNPYSDTGIYNDDEREIKKILTGIDISTGEVVMADRLGDIDLILGHHPMGKGLANIDQVMHMQADIYAQYGVPIHIAESLMRPRISEISRGVNPANVNKSIDAAKILSINIMNVHTPADNMVATLLKNKIAAKKLEYVGEVVDLLKEIPEYKKAIEYGQGPTLFNGSEENRCGKIAVSEITGGTEGSPKIYQYLSQAGIGTVIGMHQSEDHKKEAEKHHVNIIIAGHISSDNIGMNLFLDELEKKGIEIVPCSGITRVKRFKK